MRQFTTPEQTAKLIELGFEKPKIVLLYAQSVDCDNNYGWKGEAKHNYGYTIGELIEMLPAKIDGTYCNIDRCGQRSWAISYDPMIYCCNCAELVNALYDMIIELKKDGVI